MRGSAKISECGKYRYWLTRQWGESPNRVVWVMLNPSTADAQEDDPTIRKCVGFSRIWSKQKIEYGGIVVVNLFAYRASKPSELKEVADPFGPFNHKWQDVFLAPKAGNLIVAAWGANGSLYDAAKRFKSSFGVRTMCLGYTNDGEPRHPLMAPYSCQLEPFK
jgi:hypothetical protein